MVKLEKWTHGSIPGMVVSLADFCGWVDYLSHWKNQGYKLLRIYVMSHQVLKTDPWECTRRGATKLSGPVGPWDWQQCFYRGGGGRGDLDFKHFGPRRGHRRCVGVGCLAGCDSQEQGSHWKRLWRRFFSFFFHWTNGDGSKPWYLLFTQNSWDLWMFIPLYIVMVFL